jgi:hypothetical protein
MLFKTFLVPEFGSTVDAIVSMIEQRGLPNFMPLEHAYLDQGALPTSEQHLHTNGASMFHIPEAHRLKPQQPHPDPQALLMQITGSDKSASAAGSNVVAVKLQPNASSQSQNTAGTRKAGSLRATALLVDRKPFQQKKVVKQLTEEQLTELRKQEVGLVDGSQMRSRGRGRLRVTEAETEATAPVASEATAAVVTQDAELPESALKRARAEDSSTPHSVVPDLLASLTSLRDDAAQPATMHSNVPDLLASLTSLRDDAAPQAMMVPDLLASLTSLGGDLKKEPVEQPRSSEAFAMLNQLGTLGTKESTSIATPPTPAPPVAVTAPIVVAPLVAPAASISAPVATVAPTKPAATAKSPKKLPPAPVNAPVPTFTIENANRLNSGDREFITSFSANPTMANPDPMGGDILTIVMHEVEEDGFLVNYVFEANFKTHSFRRVKRKRKL